VKFKNCELLTDSTPAPTNATPPLTTEYEATRCETVMFRRERVEVVAPLKYIKPPSSFNGDSYAK
jgi:hypothetical protein